MATQQMYEDGIQRGWKITDGAGLQQDLTDEADVIVVGSGAGGGTTAEILARAGLRVIVVEEGRLYYQKDFRMDEQWSYSRLYQEGMSRVTYDGGIAILQGRCVGGSTTVNWTSSFRTPDATLAYWQSEFGLEGASPDAMGPWFGNREERLNIHPWTTDPNANNGVLRDGCERLGWEWDVIPRNVSGCWNLGYCGFGCPTNAKLGSLVTTIPGTLDRGGALYHSLRVDRLTMEGDRVTGISASALDKEALKPTGIKVNLRARHVVLAASALGTPALLLRSGVPDPHGRLGQRTFLHPVNATVAEMPERMDPYYGAPQSIYSDQFVWRDGVDGEVGFKLEVPPLHPAMSAAIIPLHGKPMRQEMGRLPWMQSVIALLRDGFHPESPGGTVSLRDNGEPVLDYPLTDYLWRGMRESFLRMGEVQFAAGAKRVRLVHMDSPDFLRWPEYKKAVAELPMALHRVRVFTAHQMGGCAMGADPRESVVDSQGRHHQLAGLSIHDASIFPTSIGANPQLSIYAFSARNATALAASLG